MKIEITKRFIYNFKWVEVGTIMDYSSLIPEGHYKEIKEPVKIEKSKKEKNEYL